MALFGSKKSQKPETTSLKKVRPVVVRTQNVASELFKIAKSYDMKPDRLDFNLFDVQTYTRVVSDATAGDGEWIGVSPDQLHNLDKERDILNPNFQIKQVYEVEIFLKESDPHDPMLEFKTAVGANATKSKVYLSVLAGSKLSFYPKFSDDFAQILNKKKVRAGILIYIFDEMVEPLISKISLQLQVAEELQFVKNETYLIAQSYEPTPTVDDKIILHYETNHEIDDSVKINYAERGFIQSAMEGDLLIEYIKPRLGKAGRNCKGEYLKPKAPVTKYEPKFLVDGTIKVVEDAHSIKYYARVNGYIAFENNTYLIKTDVDINEISFRKTGSIESGINSDVNISVREADAIKDAVGAGLSVEVTEIEVHGNVGSNAKVVAKRAKIGGQTHRSAMIRADELSIHVHKGKAYGKKIAVDRLEHGEIVGSDVHVVQALGGHIYGRDVEVEKCASHVHISASRRIEIEKLVGSENSFTIDPLAKKEDKKHLQEHKQKIKEIEEKLQKLQPEISKYKIAIKEGMPAFIEIKKRLMHYKKSGVKMPSSFVKKYKHFQKMQEHLKEITKEGKILQDKLTLLTTRTVSFQDNIFDARVIMKDRWKGYNEIKFKLVDPPIELLYKPMENSDEHIFGLVQLDEENYAIRPMSEE